VQDQPERQRAAQRVGVRVHVGYQRHVTGIAEQVCRDPHVRRRARARHGSEIAMERPRTLSLRHGSPFRASHPHRS